MLFELRPSRTFVLLLSVLHLLAIFSVSLTDIVLWARLSLALVVVASFLHALHQHLSWHSFSLTGKEVLIRTSGGKALSAELTGQTLVTARCVLLCARSRGAFFTRVIFWDAMPADAFRELRVRLRFA